MPSRSSLRSMLRRAGVAALATAIALVAHPAAAATPQFLAPFQLYPTFVPPVGVAIADMNGDGRLDIVSANQWWASSFTPDSGTVSVLLALPGGGYGKHIDADAGRGVAALAVGDFDGDGYADVAVANSTAGTISILTGTGDGHLVSRRAIGVPAGPNSIAVADFDHDGHLDLATACDSAGVVEVLFGMGDGTFGRSAVLGVGPMPRGVITSDFDGDGNADPAVVLAGSNSVAVLRGDGSGGFEQPTVLAVGQGPVGIVAADLDGDGLLDLAALNQISASVSLFHGGGTGSFTAIGVLATPPAPVAIAAGDLDGDGRPDLVVAYRSNGSTTDGIVIRPNLGGGSFGPAVYARTGARPTALLAADVDGDGRRDLVVGSTYGYGVCVHSGNGNGSFGFSIVVPTLASVQNVFVADFDGDGHLDLAGSSGDTIFVWRGAGDGGFSLAYRTTVGPMLTAMAVGDVDGDGLPDIACGTYSQGLHEVLRNRRHFAFSDTTLLVIGGTARNMQIADVTHDGKADVVFLDDNGYLVICQGDGAGLFSYLAGYPSAYGAEDLVIADLDGDGWPESITANWSGSVSVYLGSTGLHVEYGSIIHPLSVTVADVDGDGHLDVVTGNNSSQAQSIAVLYGRGDATLGDQQNYFAGGTALGSAVADFNGDGFADIAVAPASNAVNLLNGHGRAFDPPGGYGATYYASEVIAADVNGDGLPDLVTNSSNYGSGVAVLLNTGGLYNTPVAFDWRLVDAVAGRVAMEWRVSGGLPAGARVERRPSTGGWLVIGAPVAEAPELFRFQDATVVAGGRYGYRLAWEVEGRTQHSPENWVTVPAAPGVAMFDVAPNPARGAFRVRFTLAAGSSARLDVCDIAGRRVLTRECLAGSAETAAALPTASLAPGVYLVRLTAGRTVLTRRVALLN